MNIGDIIEKTDGYCTRYEVVSARQDSDRPDVTLLGVLRLSKRQSGRHKGEWHSWGREQVIAVKRGVLRGYRVAGRIGDKTGG